MLNRIFQIAAISFLCFLGSCSTDMNPTHKSPGFLPDYSLLKPVASPAGTHIYTYTAPGIKRENYNAVILTPVTLYQTAVESGVTAEQIESARQYINNGIRKIASNQMNITQKPGTGVVRVYVSITGAILEGEGFKPRNIIPISAAIKLASMATGMDNKKPVLVIEIKILDSQSGKLLKETVSTISGENFRVAGHTAEEFQKLAVEWVRQAFLYSQNK